MTFLVNVIDQIICDCSGSKVNAELQICRYLCLFIYIFTCGGFLAERLFVLP